MNKETNDYIIGCDGGVVRRVPDGPAEFFLLVPAPTGFHIETYKEPDESNMNNSQSGGNG